VDMGGSPGDCSLGGKMRKVVWGVLLVDMALAAIGNLIGGTDTPVRGALDPAAGSSSLLSDIPSSPRFDATLIVSASNLNMRAERALDRDSDGDRARHLRLRLGMELGCDGPQPTRVLPNCLIQLVSTLTL